jgi:hypothetical protein
MGIRPLLLEARLMSPAFFIRNLVCSDCDEEMHLIAVVPPLGGPYGLRLYVCPRCDRSKDVLIPQSAKESRAA